MIGFAIASPSAQAQGSVSTAGDDDVAAEFVPVPELVGAVSADIGLTTSFALGGASDRVPALGLAVALGWRHYLDIHGALAVATRIRGGAAWGRFDDVLGHVGLELAFALRGYSDAWLYGELALVAAADLMIWSLDDAAQAAYGTEATELGYRVGAGLETDVGLLWYLGPYLFSDVGAQAILGWTEVGGASGVTLEMRWRLRFDWAIPRDVVGEEAPLDERERLFDGSGEP